MSSDDLSTLYQELILTHAKSPHGEGDTTGWPLSSHQVNPTCGDEVTVAVRLESDQIAELRWEGHGCAISQASASLMAGLVESRPVDDVVPLVADFREAMRSQGRIELTEDRFGDAVALNGVARYVGRVKCAMLPWVALENALSESQAGA